MISDRKTAKQIKELMLEVDHQLEASLEMVQQRCPAEEFKTYKKAVGRVVCKILSEVIEPLYEKNPELKPPGWDE
jgi:hypothetical protein